MKVLLVTVVTLTTAIVLCSAADPECKLRMQKGLPPHWPNPSDCGRFYRCTPKNVKREVICPPEREYNQKTGKCALRGKGTCNLSQIAPAADDTDVCNGQPDNTFLPRQGYCRDFYVCSGNAATLNSCVVGTIYNAAIEGCVTDETDSCWQNQCVGVTDNTWRPIATSCLSYYICNANDATLQFCNSGSYFDLGENACIPDVGNTNCWENFCLDKVTGVNIPNTDDCHSYYTCNDQVSVQETCQDGYYFDTNTLECLVGDCPIETCTCPGGYEAGEMLPHPTDCTRFYICDNSKLLEQSCPVGTYFDCNVKACEQGTCSAITTPNRKKRSLLDTNISDIQTDIKDNQDVIPMDAEVLNNEKTLLQLHETILNVPVSGIVLLDEVPSLVETIESIHMADIEDNEDVIHMEAGVLKNKKPLLQLKETVLDEVPSLVETIEPIHMANENETIEAIHVANENETIEAAHVANENETISNSKWETALELMCMDRYFEGDFIADPENCQQFHICLNAQLVVQTCSPGTYFDENLLICNIDENDACKKKLAAKAPSKNVNKVEDPVLCTCEGGYTDGTRQPHLTNCSLYNVCNGILGKWEEQACGFGNIYNELTECCEPDTDNKCWPKIECTCPGNIQPGDFAPHPTNCSLFYVCDGIKGELNVQACGYGNIYNELTECCEPDTDNKCWPKIECTCPGNIKPWTAVPHPDVCSLFYICNGNSGALELQNCGIGNRFDNDTKACVPDTCGICNAPPGICVGQKDNTMMANPSKCYAFYLCLNEEPKDGECGATQWFDPLLGYCVVDSDAKCRNPCENINGIDFLPHPTNCTKFYFCNDGTTTVKNCDPGSSFDEELGLCMSGLSNCGSAVCIGKDDGETFPVKGDDTSFYYCQNGEGILEHCDPGTKFNVQLGICLAVPSDDCYQDICVGAEEGLIAPTKDNQTTSFCVCRNNEAFLSSCNAGYTFDLDRLVCLSSADCDPVICPNSPDYTHFPNKNNNQSFCLCVSNEAIIVDCPKNGIFNPSVMECQVPVSQDPNCDPTTCPMAPQYNTFPSLTDTNTTFCICIDGGATLLDCPAGSGYSETMKICLSNEPPFDITKCQSGEIFFPVPNNMYAFYYCSDENTVQLINCPIDTVYLENYKACLADPCNQTVCEDPEMADTAFAALGNPYIFCYCEESKAIWRACDAGTMFNPKYGVCLSESANPDCDVTLCLDAGTGGTIPAINDPNGFCYCTSSNTAVKYSCNPGSTYDPILNVCMNKLLCNGIYEQYEVVANADVCNKYFLCFNGDLLDLTCADGLYFDSTALQCLPNNDNKCQILGDNCTCPGGYHAGDFLPHPSDCSLYYICSGGKLIQSSCGTNNFFDKVTNSCQKDTTNCCATSATRTCVGNYREGEFVPHPTNVQSYYICTNARLMPASCGTGNMFDRKSNSCTVLPRQMTSYKWKRSSFEMEDVRALFTIKPIIKKLTDSFGNLFA